MQQMKECILTNIISTLSNQTTQIPYTLDLSTYDVNLVEKLEPGERNKCKTHLWCR